MQAGVIIELAGEVAVGGQAVAAAAGGVVAALAVGAVGLAGSRPAAGGG
ncbi:MAG: hypothetical protein R2911_31375 [Caldilineaceae bacterium]